MNRAIVLIGVQKADQLPELAAVWKGVADIARWAGDQGFERVESITDETGPVDIGTLSRTIREIIDESRYDQLVVYFAGHGINNGQNEYWLLSDAKRDSNAAVNLSASEDMARYNGIPHVVFISDACRTAARGISQQRIDGGSIFPNGDLAGQARKVDVFYATTLGRPALEIADVEESSRAYSALYTDVLVEALDGKHFRARSRDADLGHDVVAMWDLDAFLGTEVPVRAWELARKRQTPDAIITSRPGTWLSKLTSPPPASRTRRRGTNGADDPPPGAGRMAARMLRETLWRSPSEVDASFQGIEHELDPTDRGLHDLGQRTAAAARPFGPLHFKTGWGFKVAGARVTAVYGHRLRVVVTHEADFDLVLLDGARRPATNAVLAFDNGTCVVLPALHEYMAGLTFLDRELVNVSYDPMDTSPRWETFQMRRQEIWQLRSVAAAASAMGTFRLPAGAAGAQAARRMQLNKAYDPTLALYAAYAYRDQGKLDRLHDMAGYQADDLGLMLFDVAMLARRIDGKRSGDRGKIFPFAPLLSQGWALLLAHDLELPPAFAPIRDGVITDSLWTLYDNDCLDALREVIERGDV